MRREMGDVVVVPKQRKTPQNEGFAMRGVHFRRNIPEKKKKKKKTIPARFLRSLAAVFVIADILVLAVLVVAAIAFILGSVGFVAALIPVSSRFRDPEDGWAGGAVT
jgi:Mn2+/Fe2+ NRAMP family transporter